MSITDPIADLLVHIRNAYSVRRESVEIPFSNLKLEIVKVLKGEGYFTKSDPVVREGKKWIRVGLKYMPNRQSVIRRLVRVSRPGRRIYADRSTLIEMGRRVELLVISTSRGVMSHRRAIQENHGGEVLMSVS